MGQRPAEYDRVGGGPRYKSWNCYRWRRALPSELSGTALYSHSGDNPKSKVWVKGEGALDGEERLNRDNGEHRSSSASFGMGDSSTSMGGRDCVGVGNVGGRDMGSSQVGGAFVITEVESRTGLIQGCRSDGV